MDMIGNLSFEQLRGLLFSVFALQKEEKGIAIILDLPGGTVNDNTAWQDRRTIASEWFSMLQEHRQELPFVNIYFCVYPNVGTNNGDLPAQCVCAGSMAEFGWLPNGRTGNLNDLLGSCSVVLAPTEFSATAPLKNMARTLGFRGATLPGFTREMIPALLLDYEKVHQRVEQFKQRMDNAEGVRVVLEAAGKSYESYYDLRFRTGHASGGLIRTPGQVANLPSGEAYIVPYEGEKAEEPSRTSGLLPVQFGGEIVVYRLEGNRAAEVLTTGAESDRERALLAAEPAYANIAEVGMGVLGEWGVQAVGSILLDEKLGLHIAFGRSDHFGGVTSPAMFSDPSKVVHIDRVYVTSSQPLIAVKLIEFLYAGNRREQVLTNGAYTV
jgi:hypothetical protein